MTALMHGKVVVVTGGTSGIGQVAAERLAGMGARIVLVARDQARGQAAVERLRTRAPGIAHSLHLADLSVLGETKRVAAGIAAAEPRIDVLINNAGALFNVRQVTPDGLEATFATNHMAYFTLTEGLRERLLSSAPARIVNTASAAHRGMRLDFDDLQAERSFAGWRAYGRSKLCNILFTRELARRLDGTGVTANCLHPGFVATRFGDTSGGVLGPAMRIFKWFAISPEKGAETIVYLASSPAVAGTTGGYFIKSKPATPSKAAQNDRTAARLWSASARIAGLN
jgi:NAD(P)-dependent dehydrogenase (short-subunit alcohol dehydrogenase family)